MSIKTRLVLIDDADLDAMKADLANPEVMDYYWRHTGRVTTFWMTQSEFRKAADGRAALGVEPGGDRRAERGNRGGRTRSNRGATALHRHGDATKLQESLSPIHGSGVAFQRQAQRWRVRLVALYHVHITSYLINARAASAMPSGDMP